MSLRCASRTFIRAVQGALRDQGSRPWSVRRPENPTAAGQARRRSGASERPAVAAMATTAAEEAAAARRKLREAEKAETVMQLICWGPK
ncbi:unnamed protein product [Spirodela intermedia]|uniref:Uncharacterized protein n=1 Tax=Spirodela intermedia TaxID=51605 RepID=A0A7I8JPC3_SPIIN|nr:unnamed protein product [Spirodela intermedia]CAA6672024.1 unnamed protein product [Spirodela intermedia]